MAWMGGIGGLLEKGKATLSQVAETIQKEKEAIDREGEKFRGGHEAFSVDTTHARPAWERPGGWEGDRRLEWEAFVMALPDSPRTFTTPPYDERGLSEVKMLVEGLERLMPDASVTIEACPGLKKCRFDLVPRSVPEGEFFARYFWKVGQLGQCGSCKEAGERLLDLNTSPKPEPQEGVDEAKEEADYLSRREEEMEVIKAILERPLLIESQRLWVESNRAGMEEAIKDAKDSVSLLERVLDSAKSDAEREMGRSLLQGCQDHKARISQMMSDLPSEGGCHGEALLADLIGANSLLAKAIRSAGGQPGGNEGEDEEGEESEEGEEEEEEQAQPEPPAPTEAAQPKEIAPSAAPATPAQPESKPGLEGEGDDAQSQDSLGEGEGEGGPSGGGDLPEVSALPWDDDDDSDE